MDFFKNNEKGDKKVEISFNINFTLPLSDVIGQVPVTALIITMSDFGRS